MKKISYLLLILIILSCSTKDGNKETQVEANSIISETIIPEEFQKKISVADHPVILDVRTRGEVAQGYISGATNIDFRGDDFEERLNALDKEATYFVYCGSGGRSRQTADRMKELKFKKVYDLKGGFGEWTSKGLPTELPE